LPGVGTIGVDQALKCRSSGLQVSLEKRALPERRQRSGVARINLKNSVPQPVSLVIPTRMRGSCRLGFERVDFLEVWVGIAHRLFSIPERLSNARGSGTPQLCHEWKAPPSDGGRTAGGTANPGCGLNQGVGFILQVV
jgi:hypothetical protein